MPSMTIPKPTITFKTKIILRGPRSYAMTVPKSYITNQLLNPKKIYQIKAQEADK